MYTEILGKTVKMVDLWAGTYIYISIYIYVCVCAYVDTYIYI